MKRNAASEYKRVVQTISRYYANNRRDFPWRISGVVNNNRRSTIAYRILVSEVMLQQTQAERVVSYYRLWCKRFPTVESLSRASLSEVLILWKGLGYNRRAKYLLESARNIVTNHNGKVPTTLEALVALPGVGVYTAGAILAFAYNTESVFLETNIRTVLIHFFYKEKEKVTEKELLATANMLWKFAKDAGIDVREWGYALMDYGAHLKKSGNNHVARAHNYRGQSAFNGSTRQIRGAIVRELTIGSYTLAELSKKVKKEKSKVEQALHSLVRDGLVTKRGVRYMVPNDN